MHAAVRETLSRIRSFPLRILLLLFGFFALIPMKSFPKEVPSSSPESLLKASGELLFAVRSGAPSSNLEASLANASMSDLNQELSNDRAKTAFWVNIYNAYFQILTFREKLGKDQIFKAKKIAIAGNPFSLDQIEHGILRRYRWKYSLGYLPDWTATRLIRQLAVDAVDGRIHFALNCGAVSCPPIAFYDAHDLEKQLETATLSFLSTETTIDDSSKTILTTRLFKWFSGDFGGRKAAIQLIENHLKRDLKGYRLKFKPYDWTTKMANFQ